MKKAKFVSLMYEKQENARPQGTYEDIKPYLERGYFEKENRNGYHILYKPVRVLVHLKNDKESKIFNMKDDIRNYYGREKISPKLCNEFEADSKAGKIDFFLEDGQYSFNKH